MDNKDEQIQILEHFKNQIALTWNSSYVEDFRQCFLFVKDFSVWIECLDAI